MNHKPRFVFSAFVAVVGIGSTLVGGAAFAQSACKANYSDAVKSVEDLLKFTRFYARQDLYGAEAMKKYDAFLAENSKYVPEALHADTLSDQAASGVLEIKSATHQPKAGIDLSLTDYKKIENFLLTSLRLNKDNPKDLALMHGIETVPAIFGYDTVFDSIHFAAHIQVNSDPYSNTKELREKGYLAIHLLSSIETLLEPKLIELAQQKLNRPLRDEHLDHVFDFCTIRTYQGYVKTRINKMLDSGSGTCANVYARKLLFRGANSIPVVQDAERKPLLELPSDDEQLARAGFRPQSMTIQDKKDVINQCPKID